MAEYVELGALICRLRARAGIGKQADLARRLGVAQQTVSRWEQGLSRPRANDLPRLATLLDVGQDELFAAAGYAPDATTATFDQPFPLNALSPDSFERFCAYFLERLYREQGGRVHRAGGKGHRQEGIDIAVSGPFGRHTFECKRVDEFGPKKVLGVIARHNSTADRKCLLLAGVASPQARDVVDSHPGWELWDREDISLKVRTLPKADQRDLVDTFFRGNRLALLGEPEPGPWMSVDQFFRPFLSTRGLFTHNWDLVGREREVDALVKALRDESVSVVLLMAPGGGGKTRLLRHVVTQLEADHFDSSVWFVSPTEDVSQKHLEDLGQGPKLLVADDAHERSDLRALVQYCAIPENRSRLLLALRPYASEAVKFHAASLNLSGPLVREVAMGRPSRLDATALAEQVLAGCGGPIDLAPAIAAATYDSPLATVIGAQLVAQKGTDPGLLANVDDFNTHLLASFQDVVTGSIASGSDTARLQGILRILALVQPVLPDEPRLLSLLKDVEQIAEPDAARLLRLLIDAGILFRRGIKYRLSPDVLADSLVMRSCLTYSGGSSKYAEQVFEHAESSLATNVLVNLARLDWRLRAGGNPGTQLHEDLWRRLDQVDGAHLDAAVSVAFYQPRSALQFAKRLIANGGGADPRVCQIIKYAAHNIDVVDEACELLWQLGRNDPRPLNQHPWHPIRVLREMAAYEPAKPVEFTAKVVEFALAMTRTPSAFTGPQTPYVILEGALEPEGHSTVASTSRTVTVSGYAADLRVVAPVRERVIGALLSHVSTRAPREGVLAARALGVGLRWPAGRIGLRIADEDRKAWTDEFENTLERVAQAAEGVVSPVVLVRLAESVAMHAFNGSDDNLGWRVLSLLDRDLPTRLTRALIDGWGNQTWPFDRVANRRAHSDDFDRLLAELRDLDPARTFDLVDTCLRDIFEAGGAEHAAPQVFVGVLIRSHVEFAREVLRRFGSGQPSQLGGYVGLALGVGLSQAATSFKEQLRTQVVESPEGLRLLAEAYASVELRAYDEGDVALLRDIFGSRDEAVLRNLGSLVLQVARIDKPLALDLICTVDVGVAGRSAHDVFMWLSHEDTLPLQLLTERHWRTLLKRLEAVQELDDYWIRRFLKAALQVVPDCVIDLVLARMERIAASGDWSFVPLEQEHGNEGDLELQALANCERHLQRLFDWALRQADNHVALYRFGDAIAGLCGVYRSQILDFMVGWLAEGAGPRATVAAEVLREAQNELVLDHPQFVRDLLGAAQVIGPEAVERLSSALCVATISGARWTSPGEPFAEDVNLERHAVNMLASLSRWDPAHTLYTRLLQSARSGIATQAREKALLDAEDEEI